MKSIAIKLTGVALAASMLAIPSLSMAQSREDWKNISIGAAALGDIGRHFSDTDAQFKGADSAVLLAEAARRVRAKGFEIGNIDSTIVAQAPKLAPHIEKMRERIAQVLGLDVEQVNVKAKTAEKLGPVGQQQAMEARAVALLVRAG